MIKIDAQLSGAVNTLFDSITLSTLNNAACILESIIEGIDALEDEGESLHNYQVEDRKDSKKILRAIREVVDYFGGNL